MENEYTQVEHPDDFEGATEIWSCNDCGAYADKPENVKHHESCNPGEARRWEEYYSRQENQAP